VARVITRARVIYSANALAITVVSYAPMRTARAKVVNGKVVTRAKFPEGTKLLLVVDEPQPELELDEEDVTAIRNARASIRAGRKIPMDRLMKLLPA